MKHKEKLLHILQVKYSHRLMVHLFCSKFFSLFMLRKALNIGRGGRGGGGGGESGGAAPSSHSSFADDKAPGYQKCRL